MKETWNNVVTVISILLAIASGYTIYAAGLSIYFLDVRPLEIGAGVTALLIIAEIIFGALAF